MSDRYAERRKPMHTRPFVGVDGEGGLDLETSLHRYGSLRIGNELLDAGRPLKSKEIFEFILSQDQARFVGYGLNYDFTHWLYDLPYSKLKSLKKNGYIWWEGYRIACIADKYFEVSKRGQGKRIIFDVLGIFQTSFLKALETWHIGTPEQLEQIREGKSKRGTFVLPIDPETEAYNILEVQLLEELMGAVDQACINVGLYVQRWHGAGAIAEALLEKNHTADYIGVLPEPVAILADYAYFGGRFDIAQYGRVGTIWEYDLASAYPWAMVDLPCLAHGSWHYWTLSDETDAPNCQGKVALGYVRWKVDYRPEMPWAPFPWRTEKGRIIYPQEGEGWYYLEEIEAAKVAFPHGIFVIGALSWFNSECEHRPFQFIPTLYLRRQELGKSQQGIVLKLALNSLYGKAAQQIGRAPFSQPIWAGLITAKIRARLLLLMKEAGANGIMTATDAVYSSTQLSIETGTHLGEWEEHGPGEDAFIAQTGVYFASGLQMPKMRGRGIALQLLSSLGVERALREAWEESGPLGSVNLAELGDIGKGFITWSMAAHFPEYYRKRGQWVERHKDIKMVPTGQKLILPLEDAPEVLHLYPPQCGGAFSYPRQKSRADEKKENLPDAELWAQLDLIYSPEFIDQHSGSS